MPRAGGGVYGEDISLESTIADHRCAYRRLTDQKPFCSNNREQNKIINELVDALPALSEIEDKENLIAKIRQTRLGQLIEFSRAVHAEMDALLSASREGTSTVGTRLFVTTFPCHYCARHIVSAGVHEVQFVEPYPKSLALMLHDDAIETAPAQWNPPGRRTTRTYLPPSEESIKMNEGKVLFHPFVGVAPRLYIKAFQDRRQLKDKITGELRIEQSELGEEWSPFTKAYPELEAVLSRNP